MNKQRIKKGYTIIELLTVIAIISILLIIMTISVISKIKTSKEKGNDLTEKNITDSAVLYIKEKNSSLQGWHYEYDENGIPNMNSKYYCVTVEELINSGYFNKNIINNGISKNTYVKVTKNEENKNYITSGLLEAEDNTEICQKYTVSFIDKNNNIIIINDNKQQSIVDSGYKLSNTDFPNITFNSEYYSFSQGSSKFVYNGKWEDENGNSVDNDYVVKKDTIVRIKYSLESGNGDAFLLARGQQRPFDGESDTDTRYNKGADIVLTDNNGTSLADFVLNCPDTSNCVLALGNQSIEQYLTLETKNVLSTLELNSNEKIDWYVLKYVNGTWHLDGQIHSDFTIGFISMSRLNNNVYANCKYINNSSSCNYSDGYNLAVTQYNKNLLITSIVIKFKNNTSIEYTLDSLNKIENDITFFSTGAGYYTNTKISKDNVQNIKEVILTYQENGQSKQITYAYFYNGGMYIFKLL